MFISSTSKYCITDGKSSSIFLIKIQKCNKKYSVYVGVFRQFLMDELFKQNLQKCIFINMSSF